MYRLIVDYGNNIHMKRYVKIITYYMSIQDQLEEYETHHIYPTSLYPEFKDEKWNLVNLPIRAHYIVHWLLAKATNTNKMWFAFNMMSRVIQSDVKKSSLYRQARKYISNAISESNTGREMPEHLKEMMSERTRGKVVVRDKNGEISQVSVDDERYINGELVYYRVGYKHNDETIDKMKRNGLRDRKRFKNVYTDEFKFFGDGDDYDSNVWVSDNSDISKKMSESMTGAYFYHDPVTKRNTRVKEGDEVPEGYIRGRYFHENKGFEIANSMKNVVDLKNRKCAKVHEVLDYHAKESGRGTKNTLVIVYKDGIFTSWNNIENHLYNDGVFIESEAITKYHQTYRVKKPHSNTKPKEKNDFRRENQGKSLVDLGIYVYRLEEFDLDEHKNKVIVWN